LSGLPNGGKAGWADHQHGPVFHEIVERLLLTASYGLGVEVRSSFVENQIRCILEDRPGDCQTADAVRPTQVPRPGRLSNHGVVGPCGAVQAFDETPPGKWLCLAGLLAQRQRPVCCGAVAIEILLAMVSLNRKKVSCENNACSWPERGRPAVKSRRSTGRR